MSAETKTFSESWYRVAGQRVALRPHVQVRRQIFRGERYYVVHDPFNNQFFRLRPEAYAVVGRLRLDHTVEEVWKECLDSNPEEAPGQEDMLQLLAQLHGADLLQSTLSPDSAKLFTRFKKRRLRLLRGAFTNVMSARFPLIDPHRFLRVVLPLLRLVISPLGAIVWLAIVGFAGKVALDHWPELLRQPEGVLAPSNLPLLYAGMVLLKLFHEFGHASMCERFGGEVHTFGVMLAFLTPMPYVDTTSSWSFRSRWPRMLVGMGGMIAELLVASAAVVVWAATGEGMLHGLAYNMIFIASVSTVLFNINPLLRFDGYYILSDLLEIPNLQTRADEQSKHVVERYLFGSKRSHGPAVTKREAAWLVAYSVCSRVYRFFLFSGILLFLATRYLIVGILVSIACLFSWIVKPIYQLGRYLAFSPRLARRRGRATLVTFSLLFILIILLGVVPVPEHFRAPGVIEAVEFTVVVPETDGQVEKILAQPGSEVKRGDPLVELSDPEIAMRIAATKAQRDETVALREHVMAEHVEDLKPVESRLEAIDKQLRRLEQEQNAQIIRAAHDGTWVAPELSHWLHSWVIRGTELGQVVNQKAFYFSAVVSENDVSRLFEGKTPPAEVRLYAQPGVALKVAEERIIPADQEVLPSAALGWRGGGEIAVNATDRGGVRTREPFFAVKALLQSQSEVALRHGWTGKIRFDLPARPLLSQWVRRFHQLLQKRYGL